MYEILTLILFLATIILLIFNKTNNYESFDNNNLIKSDQDMQDVTPYPRFSYTQKLHYEY